MRTIKTMACGPGLHFFRDDASVCLCGEQSKSACYVLASECDAPPYPDLRQAVIAAGQKAFQRVTAQPDYPNNGSAADAGWVAAARTALEHVKAQIQGDIDAYNSIQLSEIGFGKVRAWEQCVGYLDAALAQLTPAGEEPTDGNAS